MLKRNLISILILALLIVNTALCAFILLSVMSTNNQTAKVVSDIATALELEAAGGGGGYAAGTVSMADTAFYSLDGDDEMTIALRMGDDGKQHYALVDMTISMNTTDPDYASYGAADSLDAAKGRIKSVVQNIVGAHTLEDCINNKALIEQEVLTALQDMYGGSPFIYEVSLTIIGS